MNAISLCWIKLWRSIIPLLRLPSGLANSGPTNSPQNMIILAHMVGALPTEQNCPKTSLFTAGTPYSSHQTASLHLRISSWIINWICPVVPVSPICLVQSWFWPFSGEINRWPYVGLFLNIYLQPSNCRPSKHTILNLLEANAPYSWEGCLKNAQNAKSIGTWGNGVHGVRSAPGWSVDLHIGDGLVISWGQVGV